MKIYIPEIILLVIGASLLGAIFYAGYRDVNRVKVYECFKGNKYEVRKGVYYPETTKYGPIQCTK